MSVRLTTLGRYRLDEILGHGGMAVVYRGHDTELDRVVAIKLLADNLASDDNFRQRFVREARLAARLAHPNVVQLFDTGEEDGRPFIVMEYVDGETLAERLTRVQKLEPSEAVALALQTAAGLGHAHEHGLVHRDIKPQNLLLRRDGTLKIADFGIARSAHGTQLTEIGTVIGTAAYLPPEQAAGEEVTAAADIYALGVVLYEMLSGQKPYSYETLTQLLVGRHEQPIPAIRDTNPAVPPELEEIVMRCLARLPEYRPPSAAALAHALAATMPDLPARPLSASQPSEAPTRSTTGRTRVAPAATAPTRLPYRSNFIHLSRGRLVAVFVLAAVVLAAVLAAVLGGGSGSSGAKPAGNKPAIEQAHDLSNWLRAHTQP